MSAGRHWAGGRHRATPGTHRLTRTAAVLRWLRGHHRAWVPPTTTAVVLVAVVLAAPAAVQQSVQPPDGGEGVWPSLPHAAAPVVVAGGEAVVDRPVAQTVPFTPLAHVLAAVPAPTLPVTAASRVAVGEQTSSTTREMPTSARSTTRPPAPTRTTTPRPPATTTVVPPPPVVTAEPSVPSTPPATTDAPASPVTTPVVPPVLDPIVDPVTTVIAPVTSQVDDLVCVVPLVDGVCPAGVAVPTSEENPR